jgi:hypothetical protein
VYVLIPRCSALLLFIGLPARQDGHDRVDMANLFRLCADHHRHAVPGGRLFLLGEQEPG